MEDPTNAEDHVPYDAKANGVEAAVGDIAEIWCSILNIASVNDGDNFFELGGNSVKAMQIVARIIEISDADLTIRAIFDHPFFGEFCQFAQSEAAAA